jgi:cobalamin biosynthesis Mg chelatase CobN
MANPWLSFQQQYMAYNPYYMYGMNYPNGYGGEMQGAMGQPTMAAEYVNHNQLTNQSTAASSSTTNTSAPQAATYQNSPSNTTQSNVRQRTVTGQEGGQNQAAHVPTVNAVQPRPAHVGMVTLIVMWLVVVSVIALILRRIFME